MDLKLKTILFLATAGVALAGCSDVDTELASLGDLGPNPGVGTPDDPDPAPAPDPDPAPAPDPDGDCPMGTTEVTVLGATQCELSGTITEDITLTSDFVYVLNDAVFVGADTGVDGMGGDPAVLTIEAGTTIYGQDGESFLAVQRGSQIIAEGTSTSPIVFTSAEDLGFAPAFGRAGRAPFTGAVTEDPFTSEWGGLVLNGLAPLNIGLEAQGEGDSGLYGGEDPTDSSGVLRFVQVRYAGDNVTPTDQLNGLAFQGTGSGTVAENIHVHNGEDDGIEWFGGTTSVRNAVVTGAGDDSLDWTQGWTGNVQFALVIQNPASAVASDNGIEADNLSTNNDALPRAMPTFSNVTLIGALPGESDTGVLLRAGTAGSYNNFVVSNFPNSSLDVDDQATFDQFAAGNITLSSWLLDNVTPGSAISDEDDDIANDLEGLVLSQPNIVLGAPSLSGFFNGAAEQAVPATDLSATDPFFTPVDFIGAVNDDATNFTVGWTFLLNEDPTCPDVAGVTPVVNDGVLEGCTLTGTITEDITMVAGLTYFLDDAVFIGVDCGPDPANPTAACTPARLTINAGVVVEALPGAVETDEGFLTINRGSQIFANGTAAEPITLASLDWEQEDILTTTSTWGGLVINGRAPLNIGLEAQGEGDTGLYGGLDPTDNSGSLNFVRVLFAGNNVTPTDQLNGLAFQGTGSGTQVSNVQVHNGEDDGIEWFGGTTSGTNLVVTGAGDDSLDWTQGWSGNVQFAVVVQNPFQPVASDNGIEADNLSTNNDALPRAMPNLSNVTLYGALPGESDTGVLLRAGTAGAYRNFVIQNFPNASFDVDDQATFEQIAEGALTLGSFLIGNVTPGDAIGGEDDDEANDLVAFVTSQPNIVVGAPSLAPRTGTSQGFAYINGDAEAAVMAEDPTALDPTFFTSVDFIGAVPSEDDDFTLGWTVFLDQ